MAKQIIHWGTGGASGTASTRYSAPMAYNGFWESNEGVTAVVWPCDGTLSNFALEHDVALASGVTVTYTVRVNGSDTDLVVSLSSPNTSGADTSHTVEVEAGDLVSIKREVSGGSLDFNDDFVLQYLEFDSDGAESVYVQNSTSSVIVGTESTGPAFWQFASEWGDGDTSERFSQPVAMSGTISRVDLVNLISGSESPLDSGDAIQFVLVLNGVDQDGAGGTVDTRIAINDSTSSVTWTTGLPVTAGDRVHWKATVTSGSVDEFRVTIGVAFTPSVAGTFMLGTVIVESQLLWIPNGLQPSRYTGIMHGQATFLHATHPRATSYPAITESFVTDVMALSINGGDNTAGVRILIDGVEAPGSPSTSVMFDTSSSDWIHIALAMNTAAPTSGAYANVDVGTRLSILISAASINGSAVFGVNTTVQAPRAVAFGLDGNTNVHDTAGVLKVFGNLEVTGTFSAGTGGGGTIDLSSELDALDE